MSGNRIRIFATSVLLELVRFPRSGICVYRLTTVTRTVKTNATRPSDRHENRAGALNSIESAASAAYSRDSSA